jgi:uncharacterized phage protein (TIGR01671 family)
MEIMDKYKLRVWDKQEKKFISGLVMDVSENNVRVWKQTMRGKGFEFDFKKDITLVPCTGFRDETGKLIFEGDEGYIGEEKYIVKYDEKQCCFILDSEKTTKRYLTKSTIDNYGFKIIKMK